MDSVKGGFQLHPFSRLRGMAGPRVAEKKVNRWIKLTLGVCRAQIFGTDPADALHHPKLPITPDAGSCAGLELVAPSKSLDPNKPPSLPSLPWMALVNCKLCQRASV